MLFLIFSRLFWLSFSCQENFWSKWNIGRENSTIWTKRSNKQTKQKKKKKKLSNHKLIWDLLYFHIITFPWKNIFEGIPFSKICRHTVATDDWVMKNDGRLGSKKSGQLLQIGVIIINQVHNNVNWNLNFHLKALENSQTKTLGWNLLVAEL